MTPNQESALAKLKKSDGPVQIATITGTALAKLGKARSVPAPEGAPGKRGYGYFEAV